MKKIFTFAIYLLLLIFLMFYSSINLINALGVVSPYSGSQLSLKVLPGEEKIVNLELQNWDIEEELSVKGTILKGSEIAFLKNESIEVSYQVRTPVEMLIKIPAKAKVGDKYVVEYEFKQVGGGGEGMVVFSQGINRNFDVLVVSAELAETKGNVGTDKSVGKGILFIFGFFILILIIVIVLIIWLAVRNRRNRFY
ncbi:MAG: hypothetical protein AABW67_01250 [Nanoarchaeota archaeon]